jgi:putative N6-adenine-specific DNA methylase
MATSSNFTITRNPLHLFITCPPYLEELLTNELGEMNITSRRWPRGVSAPLSMENVFRINYLSRFATRVLWPLAHFTCTSREELYNEAKKIPWQEYLTLDQTFAIDANVCQNEAFRNSHFAGLVVKDAICDTFRDATGNRPSVEIYNPTIQFHLFIYENKATISFDTSGTPLFKRNYRAGSIEAPLQETLAAAILKFSDYSSADTLCDPLCGSGTFLFEAALMATKTPAAYFRSHFGFFHHPLFSDAEWKSFKATCDSQIIPLKPYSIFGGDRDRKAIDMCNVSLKKTLFPLHFQHAHLHNFKPISQPTLVIANPPYGKRLNTGPDLYAALSQFLLTTCNGKARAAILSPLRRLPPSFTQPIRKSIPLLNGGHDVFLHLTR